MKYRWGRLNLAGLHQAVFSCILSGLSLSLLKQEVQLFLDKHLSSLLNLKAWNCFQQARQTGDETFLLSSSPDFLVQEIARRLQFDRWQGTEYAVDKDGNLCHIATLIEGRAKLQWAQKGSFQAHQIVALSDSWEDILLLKWVGKAVAVNPDRRLRMMAKEKGWEIL